MRKERFDLVFPLGAGCSCSIMLREKGLQLASFPLDWVWNVDLSASSGIRATADILVGGFRNWFARENVERAPAYDSPNFLGYFDRGTRLYFTHDIAVGSDLERGYPSASAKYARRIDRFLKLLAGARRVLAVWVGDPRMEGAVDEGDIRYCLDAFQRAYPRAEFRVMAAHCVHGLRFEEMRVLRGEGYECFSFDYRAVKDGEPSWEVRRDFFAPLLERFEVADYRTRAERRANAGRERARDMERFRATSLPDLWLTKAMFRLQRHLRRRLERRGVSCDEPHTPGERG